MIKDTKTMYAELLAATAFTTAELKVFQQMGLTKEQVIEERVRELKEKYMVDGGKLDIPAQVAKELGLKSEDMVEVE